MERLIDLRDPKAVRRADSNDWIALAVYELNSSAEQVEKDEREEYTAGMESLDIARAQVFATLAQAAATRDSGAVGRV